ncbi:MAG TPA: hypothetical protein VM512_03170, partial [Burkholderiaceae bacterium]|nr:hypothetical protein [Burkholderiaceae bacterium]
ELALFRLLYREICNGATSCAPFAFGARRSVGGPTVGIDMYQANARYGERSSRCRPVVNAYPERVPRSLPGQSIPTG